MKKRRLAALLGLIGLAGVGASASVLVTSPVAAREGEVLLYKFTEGAIQFTVPAGWEVKSDNQGTVKAAPKTGGNAQIAFIALPIASDINSDDRASLFDTLVEKSKFTDLELGNYKDNETLNKMR